MGRLHVSMASLISLPTFAKPFPEEDENKSLWVSEFLNSECPKFAAYSVTKLSAGFMGTAFRLDPPSDVDQELSPLVFQHGSFAKHRAYAFHRAAMNSGSAPKLLYSAYHPVYKSVSIAEFASKGELMSYDVYTGAKPGEKPPSCMMKKVGQLLARLHKIDPEWNKDFRSEDAADAADIPKTSEVPSNSEMMNPRTDPVDKTLMQSISEIVINFLQEDWMAAAGADRTYIQSELAKMITHEILPKDGWTIRRVAMHSDFHGANIVVDSNDEPLAIDFDSATTAAAAGWDLAHIYLHVRSLEPVHDYDRNYALCEGYLSELTGAAIPSKEDVDLLLFDVLAWQYFVGLKQWSCQLLTEIVGQKWAPEKKEEAQRHLKTESLKVYVARILEARENDTLRSELIRTGRIIP